MVVYSEETQNKSGYLRRQLIAELQGVKDQLAQNPSNGGENAFQKSGKLSPSPNASMTGSGVAQVKSVIDRLPEGSFVRTWPTSEQLKG